MDKDFAENIKSAFIVKLLDYFYFTNWMASMLTDSDIKKLFNV